MLSYRSLNSGYMVLILSFSGWLIFNLLVVTPKNGSTTYSHALSENERLSRKYESKTLTESSLIRCKHATYGETFTRKAGRYVEHNHDNHFSLLFLSKSNILSYIRCIYSEQSLRWTPTLPGADKWLLFCFINTLKTITRVNTSSGAIDEWTRKLKWTLF